MTCDHLKPTFGCKSCIEERGPIFNHDLDRYLYFMVLGLNDLSDILVDDRFLDDMFAKKIERAIDRLEYGLEGISDEHSIKYSTLCLFRKHAKLSKEGVHAIGRRTTETKKE
jgi:hypothetical protein